MEDIEGYEPHITQELIDRGHARRMGHLENYFAVLSRQKMYSNFTVYAELNKGVNKRQLMLVLKLLLQNTQLLRIQSFLSIILIMKRTTLAKSTLVNLFHSMIS
ncbi:ADM_collapsed_G0021600.mRNA.1.CDS.1 [Saccharomyces cerevisiae]|nr:ADM_collapsed_G0021600.mRNA.1.CDS.1 [Saccharomyces cerevisiae]